MSPDETQTKEPETYYPIDIADNRRIRMELNARGYFSASTFEGDPVEENTESAVVSYEGVETTYYRKKPEEAVSYSHQSKDENGGKLSSEEVARYLADLKEDPIRTLVYSGVVLGMCTGFAYALVRLYGFIT